MASIYTPICKNVSVCHPGLNCLSKRYFDDIARFLVEIVRYDIVINMFFFNKFNVIFKHVIEFEVARYQYIWIKNFNCLWYSES